MDLFNSASFLSGLDPRGLFSLAAGAIGIGAGVMIYIAVQNNAALDQRFAQLDKGRTVTFTSLSDCIAQNFGRAACTASQDEALRLASGIGTTLSYGSGQRCAVKHGWCREESDSSYNSTTGLYDTDYTYYPPVKGWQALRDDLSVAVPLYQGPDESVLVRKDGHQILRDAPAPGQWQ
jgi:hypothetical protein